MNRKPLPRLVTRYLSWAGWILLIVLLVMAAWLPTRPTAAAPTPAPQAGEQESSGSPLMMVIGAIMMLSPIGWIAWQSRGKKQPDIRAACCLPVIEEGQRPFRAGEEEEEDLTAKEE